MSDTFILDVGAQYLRGPVRIAVLNAGTADQGSFAVLTVGSYPTAERVRLRVEERRRLPTGGSLRLAAFNPAGTRGSIALEVAP